ncbi:MAG: hypothetical protein LUD69_06825 [Oscillospiraceae bacterium]|nr:hypothetical protein [Oscillospiraceae bacterium]
MCDVLDRVENRGLQRGMQQGLQQGIEQGIEQDIKQGAKQGEDTFAALIQKLFALGRPEDIKRASENQEYRHTLMKEFSIPQ